MWGLARQGGGAGLLWGGGGAVCCTSKGESITTGWLLQCWGLSKGGLVSFCLFGGGWGCRDRGEERVSWNSGAICHIGMALELPGGPLIAEEFSGHRVGDKEGAWSSREWSEVMAYSSSGRASVSVAGGRVQGGK